MWVIFFCSLHAPSLVIGGWGDCFIGDWIDASLCRSKNSPERPHSFCSFNSGFCDRPYPTRRPSGGSPWRLCKQRSSPGPPGKDGTQCPDLGSVLPLPQGPLPRKSWKIDHHGYPVAAQLIKVLPYSLELTFSAILFGFLLGIPLGIPAAVRRNSFIDYFNRVFSLMGLSIPAFYPGHPFDASVFNSIEMFPVVGGGDLSNLSSNLRHLFLPALSLGLIMTAYVTRMTRSSLLNILREDYVRTARSKGISERVVLLKHALRNALIPIVALGRGLCRGAHRVLRHDGDCLFTARTGKPHGRGHQTEGLYDPSVGDGVLFGDRRRAQPDDGFDLRPDRSKDSVPVRENGA